MNDLEIRNALRRRFSGLSEEVFNARYALAYQDFEVSMTVQIEGDSRTFNRVVDMIERRMARLG